MHITTKDDRGYAYLSDWAPVPSLTKNTIEELWGTSSTISRGLVGAPDWAEYMLKNGSIMSHTGLYAQWIFNAIDTYGEKHVISIIDNDPEGVWESFEGYIKGTIFSGELAHLVD
nr:MAG TPA: hypothetical protein [Caudoviricetes sp.]